MKSTILFLLISSSGAMAAKPPERPDMCLVGAPDPSDWSELAVPPANAPKLHSLVAARRPPQLETSKETWFAQDGLTLYCRHEGHCIAETWLFGERHGSIQILEYNSGVCVTAPNNSSKPTPLRGAA